MQRDIVDAPNPKPYLQCQFEVQLLLPAEPHALRHGHPVQWRGLGLLSCRAIEQKADQSFRYKCASGLVQQHVDSPQNQQICACSTG